MVKRNILLTGAPGVGKTTLIKKIGESLKDHHIAGFYTNEIREGGRRVGFELTSFDGQNGILSHVGFKSAYNVGKYGVNIDEFERFLSSIRFFGSETGIIIIDEIGKMECFSAKFQSLIATILDSRIPCIATIAQKGTPFIEKVKKRDDVEVFEVTRKNRDSILDMLCIMVAQR
jgi:nucleoside-triphosphatase